MYRLIGLLLLVGCSEPDAPPKSIWDNQIGEVQTCPEGWEAIAYQYGTPTCRKIPSEHPFSECEDIVSAAPPIEESMSCYHDYDPLSDEMAYVCPEVPNYTTHIHPDYGTQYQWRECSPNWTAMRECQKIGLCA